MSAIEEKFEEWKDSLGSIFDRKKLPLRKQIQFVATLSRLLGTLSATVAIDLMYRNSSGIELEVLEDIRLSLKEGGRISVPATKWFDTNVVMSIRFGEDNNALKSSLEECLGSMKVTSTNLFKPFSSVIKPTLYVLFALTVVGTVGSQLVRAMGPSLNKMKVVPFEMEIVQAIISFYANYFLLTVVATAALAIGFFLVLRTYVAESRFELDRLPFFYVYRQICSLSFLRQYAFLKRFKEPDATIFRKISELISNPYLKHHIDAMSDNIRSGESVGDALDTGLIPSSEMLTLKVLTESALDEDVIDQIRITCEILQDSIISKFERAATILAGSLNILAAAMALSFFLVVLQLDSYFK